MEVTKVHTLIWNTSKSLTIILHHLLSTVTMDDPAVFTNFVKITHGVTTQQTIDVNVNFVESFGGFIAFNFGDIDNFVKDTHYANNSRAAAQRIFVIKNVTQGLKSIF